MLRTKANLVLTKKKKEENCFQITWTVPTTPVTRGVYGARRDADFWKDSDPVDRGQSPSDPGDPHRSWNIIRISYCTYIFGKTSGKRSLGSRFLRYTHAFYRYALRVFRVLGSTWSLPVEFVARPSPFVFNISFENRESMASFWLFYFCFHYFSSKYLHDINECF